MNVNFKFNVGDAVINMFGTEGVVTFLGFGDGGNQYSVKVASGETAWWKESELNSK